MKKINSIHNKTKELSVDEQPFNSRNVLLMETDLNDIFKSVDLDYNFRDINTYRTSFVHRSYSLMKNDDFETGNVKCPEGCLPLQPNNLERNEWLGDALLDFVITEYIFDKYPEQNEGWCSKLKVKFVNGKQCGYLSKCLGFDRFVMISRQLEEIGSRDNYKIQEDVFEAFIGALYLDSGRDMEIVKRFIVNVIESNIDMVELIMKNTNYKDMLNTYMMDHYNDSPKFYEISMVHVNMVKQFTYVVKNRDNDVLGSSVGMNRKDAENNAAYEALKGFGVSV
jgi:dsRNA-specific ribonuclease